MYMVRDILLPLGYLHYSHAHFWHAEFPVTADLAESGLQISVEDTTPHRYPKALGLYVYAGDVAEDFSTEYVSEFSPEGVNSVVISSHDLKECVYHAVVQCTSNSAATYRIIAQLTPANVGSLGVHGNLCGGGWAYHYVTADGASPERQDSGHGRRQLGGLSGEHVRFNVLLHTGMQILCHESGQRPIEPDSFIFDLTRACCSWLLHARCRTRVLHHETWQCPIEADSAIWTRGPI